ncbi:hypothetical protein BKA70DRAFT_1500701 [Coprinopsis sp. MPI-PUGE-AT-0042]|nr:hypothetical protein BKA70DRAFT_1500701 [Coprinopsis sp. MPI-PUGE-AT-0042]
MNTKATNHRENAPSTTTPPVSLPPKPKQVPGQRNPLDGYILTTAKARGSGCLAHLRSASQVAAEGANLIDGSRRLATAASATAHIAAVGSKANSVASASFTASPRRPIDRGDRNVREASGHAPRAVSALGVNVLQRGALFHDANVQAVGGQRDDRMSYQELAERFFQLAETVASFEGVFQREDVKLHVRTKAFPRESKDGGDRQIEGDRDRVESLTGPKRAARDIAKGDVLAAKRARRSLDHES